MNASRKMKAIRVATSSVVGVALAVGGVGTAFASKGHDHGPKGDHGLHASGTISAISATTPESLTLTLKNGATVTYATTAATTYFEGRAAASATALAVGERVDLSLNATTPNTISSVRVHLAHFEGKITAISGTAGAGVVTISGPKHMTRTIDVTAATTFEMKGQAASFASLVVGQEIGATGLVATNGTMSAMSLRLRPVDNSKDGLHASGTISAISATTPESLTLTLKNGATVTYATTAATTYFEGRAAASATALAVGERVDLSLNATTPNTISSVRVHLAHFEGKITAISGTAGAGVVTISGPKNMTRTIDVTAATTFEMKGQAASFASLVVGQEIGATGLVATNGTMSAMSLRLKAGDHSPATARIKARL